jgi:hypothetical protein
MQSGFRKSKTISEADAVADSIAFRMAEDDSSRITNSSQEADLNPHPGAQTAAHSHHSVKSTKAAETVSAIESLFPKTVVARHGATIATESATSRGTAELRSKIVADPREENRNSRDLLQSRR